MASGHHKKIPMKNWLYLGLVCAIAACNNTSSPTVATVNTEGYSTETLAGTDAVRMYKTDATGVLLEEGYMKDSKKIGAWITYSEGNVKSITTYLDGVLNGVYVELDNQKRMIAQTGYKNGDFHGRAMRFKFGRPLEEFNYKDGQLDGFYRKHFDNNGKIRQEDEYANGVRNGASRLFDEDGNVIMMYTYKNGEKVSGGVVDSLGNIVQ